MDEQEEEAAVSEVVTFKSLVSRVLLNCIRYRNMQTNLLPIRELSMFSVKPVSD